MFVLHGEPGEPDSIYLEVADPKVGARTHKALGLAKTKNARFVLASTGIAGHPQKELCYLFGPRRVRTERSGLPRQMMLDAKIVRIFKHARMRVSDGCAAP